jgi:hypothetical protein
MTAALEGGEGSASLPGCFLPPGKTRYPLYRRLGGPQGWSGQARKISPPTRIRSADPPARSESLYRLSYRSPPYTFSWIWNVVIGVRARWSVLSVSTLTFSANQPNAQFVVPQIWAPNEVILAGGLASYFSPQIPQVSSPSRCTSSSSAVFSAFEMKS